MSNTVLIVAPSGDIHALAVGRAVERRGGRAIVLDAAGFPSRWKLGLESGGPTGSSSWVELEDGEVVRDASVGGVWRRRQRPFEIPADVKEDRIRRFCAREAEVTFDAWLTRLGARVVNAPAAESEAELKPVQTEVARAAGIRVPRTLVTNSPAAVRAFHEELEGQVVFKILTNAHWTFTETRRLEEQHMHDLVSLDAAPVIFQELIADPTDIRATVVDDRVFAASITTTRPEAAVDVRLDLAAPVVEHRLPPDVEHALVATVRGLGLRYAACDLRLTDSGDYYFLEANPGGQFLFAEIEAGLPICDALAGALLEGAPSVAAAPC